MVVHWSGKEVMGFVALCSVILLKISGVTVLGGGLNLTSVGCVGPDGNPNGKGKGGEDTVLFGMSVFASPLLSGNREVT